MKIFPYSALFFILFYFIPVSAQYIEVDLNIPEKFKTLKTESVFIVISHFNQDKNTKPSTDTLSTTMIELNKFILPISLYGRHCGGNTSRSNPLSIQQVQKILPIGTQLEPIRFFAMVEKINWFEQQIFKLFHNTSLRQVLPRGGPVKYYVVQNVQDQQMILNYALSYLGDIKGLGVEKAEEVLKLFENNNRKYQEIILTTETYDEYFEKCNYGGVHNSNDPSHNPERIINEIKKMKDIHHFQNETIKENEITVTVDYLALAYLIWKSHTLRIKDIIFK